MRNAGYSVVEMLTVVAILGILASVVIPNVVQTNEGGKGYQCSANLRSIETAKSAFKADHPARSSCLEADLHPYLPGYASVPSCPVNSVPYTGITDLGIESTCPNDGSNHADGRHDLAR